MKVFVVLCLLSTAALTAAARGGRLGSDVEASGRISGRLYAGVERVGPRGFPGFTASVGGELGAHLGGGAGVGVTSYGYGYPNWGYPYGGYGGYGGYSGYSGYGGYDQGFGSVYPGYDYYYPYGYGGGYGSGYGSGYGGGYSGSSSFPTFSASSGGTTSARSSASQ
uniref:Putative glycine-rich cell wall structural protein n=1 Tax=Rhipicephalus microplus TaxID=6941 RepID=A0A6G5A6G7_RHIMP